MGLVSGQLQHRQTVCVWETERGGIKTSELITELRQPEDKQLCSLRLHIQTSQSGLLQVTKNLKFRKGTHIILFQACLPDNPPFISQH